MERIDVYKAYFGENTTYYANELEKQEQGRKITFNFSAGLFGACWFLYRKMYLEGAVIWILSILLGFIIDYIVASLSTGQAHFNNSLSNFIALVLSFLTWSLLGNYIYIKKARRVVEPFLQDHNVEEPESTDLAELEHKGGTSLFPAVLPFILAFVVLVLCMLFIK